MLVPEFMIPPADAMMTPWGPIWLSVDGIIINIGSKPSQTREEVAEYLSYIKKAGEGKARPFLVEISRVRAMSREVRDEYDKHDTEQLVTAMALVTRSAVGKMIGNILLGVSASKVPAKLFTDPEKAKAWLKQFT